MCACARAGAYNFRPDMDAILKRASVIVNSKDYFYVKVAGVDRLVRHRMPESMLTLAGGNKYMKFRADGSLPPRDELRRDIASEQSFINRLLDLDEDPMPRRWAAASLTAA